MNTSLKTCFKCGCSKPITGFYKHPAMADGHLGKCKECTKLDVAMRYRSPEGRAKIAAYELRRSKTLHRKAKAIQYQRNARAKHPNKNAARQRLWYAIRAGKITPKPCEVCGQKAEAHHVDYGHELNVRWLCFKHHRGLAHGQTINAS